MWMRVNAVTSELSSSLSLFSPESEIRLSTAFLLQHDDEEDEDKSICASADRVSLFISSIYPLLMMCCSVHPPWKLSLIYTESHPWITKAPRSWSRTSGLQSSLNTAIKSGKNTSESDTCVCCSTALRSASWADPITSALDQSQAPLGSRPEVVSLCAGSLKLRVCFIMMCGE